MVDLHLFLGRKVLNPSLQAAQAKAKGDTAPDDDDDDKTSYPLTTQTPEDVHFGSIPESVLSTEMENVRRLIENEAGALDGDNFDSLVKTSRNAMKQYKRSRPDPSREGVRRGKEVRIGDNLLPIVRCCC